MTCSLVCCIWLLLYWGITLICPGLFRCWILSNTFSAYMILLYDFILYSVLCFCILNHLRIPELKQLGFSILIFSMCIELNLLIWYWEFFHLCLSMILVWKYIYMKVHIYESMYEWMYIWSLTVCVSRVILASQNEPLFSPFESCGFVWEELVLILV